MSHRIHDRKLLDVLEAIGPVKYNGPLWRVSLEGRQATRGWKAAGRWSDGSFPVLYTSLDSEICQSEVFFHVYQKNPIPPSKPQYMLHSLEADLENALELFDVARLESLGITQESYFQKDFSSLTRNLYPITQAVGAAVNFLGLDGMLVPSARMDGNNAVLLTDNISPDKEIRVISSEAVDLASWGKQNTF